MAPKPAGGEGAAVDTWATKSAVAVDEPLAFVAVSVYWMLPAEAGLTCMIAPASTCPMLGSIRTCSAPATDHVRTAGAPTSAVVGLTTNDRMTGTASPGLVPLFDP